MNYTILEALKNPENNLRVSAGRKWLMCGPQDTFTVHEKKYGSTKTQTYYFETEAEAVEELLK